MTYTQREAHACWAALDLHHEARLAAVRVAEVDLLDAVAVRVRVGGGVGGTTRPHQARRNPR